MNAEGRAAPLTIVVVALGSAGDVHPNVALAAEAARRGHDVVLAAPAVFATVAARAKLPFVPLVDEAHYRRTIDDPDLWHPMRSVRVFAEGLILPALRPVFSLIREKYRPGRTVVAAPGFALGARIAHDALGVPLASVHLQPAVMRSIEAPPCYGFPDLLGMGPRWFRRSYFEQADRFIDAHLAGPTNALRAELGLPPVARLFDAWFHSPQAVIGFFPAWYGPPVPGWPDNLVLAGFPLWDGRDQWAPSPALERFLADGEPPIVFTAGTAMTHAERFFRTSVAVCEKLGRRGILLTQFSAQLPERLPDGVRAFDYVPFGVVLPRAAALVHHGGIGTTAQALAAGVPQLVVPATHDQPDNAKRVKRLGVGDYLTPRAYRTRAAAKRLAAIMGPQVREACRRRAADLSTNHAAATACDVLETLAGSDLR